MVMLATKHVYAFSQVVSVYAEPDIVELNYHAGTACRTVAQSVVTEHVGVRFYDPEIADAITAVFLISVCLDRGLNLAKVNLDTQATLQYLQHFLSMTTANNTLHVSTEPKEFSSSRVDKVDLYCFCLTAWIDGSTSQAIYGKLQKQYNAYQCSKCDNWFHKACLIKLHIPVPARRGIFVCSKCTVPFTIPWNHKEFTNTCTSDNFLTILMLYCQQHSAFLSQLGSSDLEATLKASIQLMNKGNITEGKSLMLKKAHEKLNFKREKNGKLDCYGTEESAFVPIWKLQFVCQCTSDFCPTKNCLKIRHQTTFSLPEHSSDTQSIFPSPGDLMGYCGAEFSTKPPNNVPFKVCDRIDASSTKKDQFYSCDGGCKILSCGFIHRNPWVIPISIEGISLSNINNLPLAINVYHRSYKLGGCTMNTGGHFVAILLWHGTPYFYDGIRSTKQQRFIDYNPRLLANFNCTGSYAYYFLSSSMHVKRSYCIII